MENRYKLTALLVFAAILMVAGPTWGQIVYGQATTGNLQFIYNNWTLKKSLVEVGISQTTVPLSGFVPLGENLEAEFYIATSSNSLDLSLVELNLSGLSDFRLQISRSFADDALLLSGGVNLPTGKKNLNLSTEWLVLQYLSQNYFNFPTIRLGEGFGFSLLFGGATMLGSVRCGAGLMYQYNGTYKPYAEAGDYNPGDLLSMNAGGDLQKGLSSFSGDIIYNIYTTDRLDGEKIFRQSPDADLRLGWRYDNKAYVINTGVRYQIRGRNTRYDEGDEILEQLKLYGNEFSAGGSVSWNIRNDWSVAPSLDMRLIAGNEQVFGSSKIYGFGATLGRKFGKNADFTFGYKYLTGSTDGGNIDLSGYQLTAGLNIGI
jgi:hypothetical protein